MPRSRAATDGREGGGDGGRDDLRAAWSHEVYPAGRLEERLASCHDPFALEVVRHGQTEANAERRFTGASDVPLTALGERQARELGTQLSGRYDLAFHSTLARSRRTLELALACSTATVGAVMGDPRLDERSLGVLEGRPTMPIPEYERDDFSYAPEGGEPYSSVARRVLSFLVDLGCAAAGREEPLRALACTHVGPMRLLIPVLRKAAGRDGVLTAKYANGAVLAFEPAPLAIPRFLREVVRGAGGYDPTAIA